ncbi:MAG TPA: tetratricopeptide repeat protein, partial [Caldimonas sp.]|nr:tetratricopeptide repeat protein [Caldimonas sp.]
MATGRVADAEEHWKTLAKDPDGDPFVLADYYTVANRLQDAERALTPLAGATTTLVPASLRLAGVQYALGKHDDAFATIDAIVKREPQNTAARVRQAQLLAMDGRLDEAMATVDAASKKDPAPELLLMRGDILDAQGSHDEAVEVLESATKMNPDDIRAYLSIARILSRQDRNDEASWWAMRARARHPEETAPTLALIEILLHSKQVDAAER